MPVVVEHAQKDSHLLLEDLALPVLRDRIPQKVLLVEHVQPVQPGVVAGVAAASVNQDTMALQAADMDKIPLACHASQDIIVMAFTIIRIMFPAMVLVMLLVIPVEPVPTLLAGLLLLRRTHVYPVIQVHMLVLAVTDVLRMISVTIPVLCQQVRQYALQAHIAL